jgi:hypothetical protein
MKTLSAFAFSLCLLLTAKSAIATSPSDSLIIQFGNRTRLIVYSTDPQGLQKLRQYDLNKIIRDMGMKLDSLPNGQTRVVDERNGDRYLKDTLLIVTRDNGQVSVEGRIDGSTGTNSLSSHWDRSEKKRPTRNSSLFFDINIGLNTWLTNSTITTYLPDQYRLLPLGSRYFSIIAGHRVTLGQAARTRFDLYYGLELAWNNYMFESLMKPEKGPTQVAFVPLAEPANISKLTVTTLSLPIMPRWTFYSESSRRVFRLGIGGFIGYRLDSYSKVAYKANNVVRDHSSFYLNDFQYGLIGQIGIFRTDLFVKYNLNPVFLPGKGPDVRSLSFGLTI